MPTTGALRRLGWENPRSRSASTLSEIKKKSQANLKKIFVVLMLSGW